MLLITAALRRLAGDTSHGAARLEEYASLRRRRFCGEGSFYPFIYPIVADLFFTSAFRLEKERQPAIAAFRSIQYQGNGWLRGARISMNVFDTALTVLALKAAGVSEQHVMVQRACNLLITARRPADGLWSWAYDTGEGCHAGQPDTDDTGAACMALACFGQAKAVRNSATGLRFMQEDHGAFSTFGDDVLRPNWCWVSNTSRSLQGMILAGLDRQDDQVQRGLRWLRSQQVEDGSWIDGWCARYIYGTALAVEALMRAGADPHDPAIRQAKDWLLKQQNPDGGWGEDWYGAHSRSSTEHTGLALYALCLSVAPGEYPRHAIEGGTRWLVDAQRKDGTWDASYFIDFGFGVGFADSQMPVVWALHGLGNAIRLLGGSSDRLNGGPPSKRD